MPKIKSLQFSKQEFLFSLISIIISSVIAWVIAYLFILVKAGFENIDILGFLNLQIYIIGISIIIWAFFIIPVLFLIREKFLEKNKTSYIPVMSAVYGFFLVGLLYFIYAVFKSKTIFFGKNNWFNLFQNSFISGLVGYLWGFFYQYFIFKNKK